MPRIYAPPEDHAGDELPILDILVAAVLHQEVGAQPIQVHVEENGEEEGRVYLCIGG